MIRSKAPFYSIGFVSIVLILSQSGQCGGSKMKASSNNSNQKVNPTQPKSEQLTGNWGGQGIVMEIATTGTTLTFDCAHGAITEAMLPDSNGKFEVEGSFTRERGGPIREDENPTASPANFSGIVDGETMTLTITLTKTKESMGTYTLMRGKTGRLRRCL